MLFHDADGCLNAPDGSPLAFDRNSLAARDEQHLALLGRMIDRSSLSHLILNTGRSWQATEFLCDAISSRKLTYALAEHGSELWNVQTKSPVSLEELAEASSLTAITEAVASRFDITRLIEWFEETGARELCKQLGYSGSMPRQTDKRWNLTFLIPDDVDGDLVFATFKALVVSQPEFQQASLVFHYSRWNRYLDVMAQMDKGLGAGLVLEHLGIDRRYSAAIGDGLNDLPMFRDVGLPICPANAEREVVELCRAQGYVAAGSYVAATMDWLEHAAS